MTIMRSGVERSAAQRNELTAAATAVHVRWAYAGNRQCQLMVFYGFYYGLSSRYRFDGPRRKTGILASISY